MIDGKKACNPESEQNKTEQEVISFGKGQSQRSFKEKSEKWKRDKQDKQGEGQEDFESIKKVLERALTGSKQVIGLKLSKVTDVVLENNPELEEKLKNVLSQVEESKKNRGLVYSAGNESRSMFSSNNNTSQQCENDTLEDIQIDGLCQTQVVPCQQDLQTIQITVQGPQTSPNHSSEYKEIPLDKKQTVKKSLMKPKEDKSHPLLLSSNVIKQISAQKQKVHLGHSQLKDQNKPANNSSINKFMDKMAQKFINQTAFVTERKAEQKPEIGQKRQFHSDNSHINHRRNQQQLKNLQNATQQIVENPSLVPAETNANLESNEKEGEIQYPDLSEYPPISSASQCRFF